MEKFALGEIKILLCINIVESGLDIQNTNTIIKDVQQFGLAQLYQIQSELSFGWNLWIANLEQIAKTDVSGTGNWSSGASVYYLNPGLQLRGRVGRADKEAHAYLFYPNKGLLSDQALERLAAIEECCELGQGFQLAERDMGIRGFGAMFEEQQSGDVENVGINLFFEMLFESLSKVEDHRVVTVPYHSMHVCLVKKCTTGF
ncbi:hypothetical protein RJT34_21517 [Clitoria ternatea]|uniref:Helicase C-terminal domain-containing protein n=1 Tax=Clitoria ternatea TaxID=43366 RepID=A0AAN9P6H6_CLITE